MSAASVSRTTYTEVEAVVKVIVSEVKDSQGRRTLRLTEADAKSLMHALANEFGYAVTLPAHDITLPH